MSDVPPSVALPGGKAFKATPGPCIFCGEWVSLGRTLSGATNPLDPAWHIDGDFGCPDSPLTTDEGTGDHARPYDLARLLIEQESRGR